MSDLPKVIDNYSATIVGNYGVDDVEITVSVPPTVITAGYITIFDFDGNQYEKIKFTAVAGSVLTVIRGLDFDEASDTPVVGNAKELQSGMTMKLTMSLSYLNPVIDFINIYLGHWEGTAANYAALPTGTNDGEARITIDDSKIYVWSTATSTWNLAGAGGGAGTVYKTIKLGTEAEGDDNKTFELNDGSFPDDKYLLVYLNGVLMENGATADYETAGGNQAVFNSVVLDTDKVSLVVISVDIYNPAWGIVTDDILPDTTDTHDIGSDTKRFKDGYFEGDVDIDGGLDVEGDVAAGTFTGNGSGITNIITLFGDGSDGNVTISTNTTITADMYYNNLTIDAGVTLDSNNFRIFIKGTLTLNGTISNDGGDGGDGQNATAPSYPVSIGGVAGIAGNNGSSGTLRTGTAGGAGATGATSRSGNNSAAGTAANGIKSNGSKGGDGGNANGYNTNSGGDAGAGGVITAARNKFDNVISLSNIIDTWSDTVITLSTSAGASGGASGAGSGTGGSGYRCSTGGGGGGGAAGGFIILIVNTIVISATGEIHSNGGSGGTAGDGIVTDGGDSVGGSGGGAGGNGGFIAIAYRSLTNNGSIAVGGGVGGNAGASSGGGWIGSNGATGTAGTINLIQL